MSRKSRTCDQPRPSHDSPQTDADPTPNPFTADDPLSGVPRATCNPNRGCIHERNLLPLHQKFLTAGAYLRNWSVAALVWSCRFIGTGTADRDLMTIAHTSHAGTRIAAGVEESQAGPLEPMACSFRPCGDEHVDSATTPRISLPAGSQSRESRIARKDSAIHEAGHAVMRWIRGLPLTAIELDTDNKGRCAGSGRLVRADDVLLVMLAGYAAESGYGVADVNLTRECYDLDYGRMILTSERWLCGSDTVDDALAYYFHLACDLLRPHADLIQQLASKLTADGYLSADTVRATLRPCGPTERGLP